MKPGRNDACPCGSGNKYKKCCGQTIAIAPAPSAAPQAARECGACTACCEGWLAGTVHGHEMKVGQPCHFLREQACSAYADRPQSPCRDFFCGWVTKDSPFPDAFRPDRLGVIIVPITWRRQAAYRLCSAGRDPDPALLQWMAAFSQKSGRPFFYEQAGETLGFGPPEFQQELRYCVERGLPLW